MQNVYRRLFMCVIDMQEHDWRSGIQYSFFWIEYKPMDDSAGRYFKQKHMLPYWFKTVDSSSLANPAYWNI